MAGPGLAGQAALARLARGARGPARARRARPTCRRTPRRASGWPMTNCSPTSWPWPGASVRGRSRRRRVIAPGPVSAGAADRPALHPDRRARRRPWPRSAATSPSGEQMGRLLQGDVGSGKTAVAVLALADAAECGLPVRPDGADRNPGPPALSDGWLRCWRPPASPTVLLTGRDTPGRAARAAGGPGVRRGAGGGRHPRPVPGRGALRPAWPWRSSTNSTGSASTSARGCRPRAIRASAASTCWPCRPRRSRARWS